MSAYNPPTKHNGSINTVYNPSDYVATNPTLPYLPLTGGTITGLLTATRLSLSSENVALGSGSGVNLGSTCVSIGYNSNSSAGKSGDDCISIGDSSSTGVAVTSTSHNDSIAIGHSSTTNSYSCVAIGFQANVQAHSGIAIGDSSTVSTADDGIAIGHSASVGASHNKSVAIGLSATSTGANQITLGTTSYNYRFAGMYANNLLSYRVKDAGYGITTGAANVLKYETVVNAGSCGVTYDTGTGIFTNGNSYTVLCNITYNNLWDGVASATGARTSQMFFGTTSGGAPSSSIAYMWHNLQSVSSFTVVNVCSMNIAIPGGFKFGIYCSQGQGSTVDIKSFSGANPSYVTVMVF